MDSAYRRALAAVWTPHKAGKLVLAPSYTPGTFASHTVDVPFVFRHDGRYYMSFVGYDRAGRRKG